MPTYEYKCTNEQCQHEFEEVQSITDETITICPLCKLAGVMRLISSGTKFVLKGQGWYADGYSSNKPKEKK